MPQRRSTSEILKMRSRREDGVNLKLIIKYSILAAVILFLSGALTSVIVYFYLSKDLPKISSLTDYQPLLQHLLLYFLFQWEFHRIRSEVLPGGRFFQHCQSLYKKS